MPTTDPEPTLASQAWLLVGLTQSRAGHLVLDRGELAFVHDDGTLLFRARLAEVRDISFPWYYFGGGCKLTVAGVRHRLSFVRPNDAADAVDRMAARVGDAGAVLDQVTGKAADIGEGRAAGRAWRAALARTT